MDRFVKRSELLRIADYNAASFTALCRRGHLPFPTLRGDQDKSKRDRYGSWMAILLVVGDLLNSKTPMTREEFGDLEEQNLVKMIAGFRDTVSGSAGWLGCRDIAGAKEIAFGSLGGLSETFKDERATSITFVNVKKPFLAMHERAEEIRPGLMDFTD